MRTFFPILGNNRYSHYDKEKRCIDDYIGETLAHIMCDCENDLDLIRIRREGEGESVCVQKYNNTISLWI